MKGLASLKGEIYRRKLQFQKGETKGAVAGQEKAEETGGKKTEAVQPGSRSPHH